MIMVGVPLTNDASLSVVPAFLSSPVIELSKLSTIVDASK
jgi:hypothetical protein